MVHAEVTEETVNRSFARPSSLPEAKPCNEAQSTVIALYMCAHSGSSIFSRLTRLLGTTAGAVNCLLATTDQLLCRLTT